MATITKRYYPILLKKSSAVFYFDFCGESL